MLIIISFANRVYTVSQGKTSHVQYCNKEYAQRTEIHMDNPTPKFTVQGSISRL